MSGFSSLAIQTSIYQILYDDAELRSSVGSGGLNDPVRVYDNVPQNTAYPYIQIGDETMKDSGTMTDQGVEVTYTLHVWARDRGKVVVKELADRIYQLLHEQDIPVLDQDVYLCRFEFFESFTDPDGITRHGVARYRFLTSET